MKKIIKYLFIFYFILLFSCTDNVMFNKEDIKKYTWLIPFVSEINYIDFVGYQNIDIGNINFSYKKPNCYKEDILLQFDSIAYNEHWEIAKKTVSSREFTKIIPLYENEMEKVTIRILIDDIKERVIFNIE